MTPSCVVRRRFGLVACLASALAACWGTAPAAAQEFRVYTRVINEAVVEPAHRGGPARHPIVGRSLTFFRAGKAYDYIDAVNEVIVLDAPGKQFTVLRPTHRLATVVTFDELAEHVDRARRRAEDRILEFRSDSSPENLRRLRQVEFQLDPRFTESWDEAAQTLTLKSPGFTYVARCVSVETEGVVKNYLRYADRTAELNFLLHPTALLPTPRLKLNEALRRRNCLPIDVQLTASIGAGLKLRAEHVLAWELDKKDRQLIHQWESTIGNRDVTFVSLEEFLKESTPPNLARRGGE
jgi:hypothetical protein